MKSRTNRFLLKRLRKIMSARTNLLASMGVGVRERHRGHRAAWLRATVLGADDGIVSVASLMIGVIASGANRNIILTAAIAALVAGALSMAAGEYVSVSSQRDTELADLRLEIKELSTNPDGEIEELAGIYRSRGLPQNLANEVAVALTKGDALAAHARDELGLDQTMLAKPIQAAFSSAGSFIAGAILPILTMLLAPSAILIPSVVLIALISLVILGMAGAYAGGAQVIKAAIRVGLGGGCAMAVTALVGHLVGKGGL
jgi:VIT1/CCC1 family predicted Fe2+/Mn2+ transporter